MQKHRRRARGAESSGYVHGYLAAFAHAAHHYLAMPGVSVFKYQFKSLGIALAGRYGGHCGAFSRYYILEKIVYVNLSWSLVHGKSF